MTEFTLHDALFRLSPTLTFTVPSLTLRAGEHWAFVGANGSGKTALARALCQQLTLLQGQLHTTFRQPALLASETQHDLLTEEWRRNNTDMLSETETQAGRTTAEIIQQTVRDPARCAALADQFGIRPLLTRQFQALSTGEKRKALLCQLLMAQPDLLVLDDPFDGLDSAARADLARLLHQLASPSVTLVLMLNRFDALPDFISHAGVLAGRTLRLTGPREAILHHQEVAQLRHSETLRDLSLPAADPDHAPPPLPAGEPLIVLRDGVVRYQDKLILQHLNWQVNPGEHWHILGPNGAGKSTLLALISGDHPQGFSNALWLFGRKRGSGETVWEIKRRIGCVSQQLHQDYRAATSVRNVILSGFYDSIGLYHYATARQQQLADAWLALLGLSAAASQPFQQLSWGQQRLLLIARALVKHPTLLILDEPLQGLDPLQRQLVLRYIDILTARGQTQLLFVSHHTEDVPRCITHRLHFIPTDDGYCYRQERCQGEAAGAPSRDLSVG